jgi:hypothetical protein
MLQDWEDARDLEPTGVTQPALPPRRQLLRYAMGAVCAATLRPSLFSLTFAAATLSQSACKPRSTAMPIDTSQWKPLAFGRFTLLAPPDATSVGTYRMWNALIERNKDITSMELLKQEVAAKQAEFKSLKHVDFGNRYINTYDLKGKGVSVWGYKRGEINDLNNLHYATVYVYYYATDPFKVWTVKRTFSMGDGAEKQELDYELKLAQAIRPLQAGEVPRGYGFVMDGGMVESDEYVGEQAEFSCWTPAWLNSDQSSGPNGFGGLRVFTTAPARATETTLFQRLDKGHATLAALLSSGKELRKRELVINGIAGQEYLYRTANVRSDWTEYHFEWAVNGKVEDNYHPDISVTFDMHTPSDDVLPPAPFKSDEDAIAFWDAALGTLQLRPVTAADGNKVSQDGAVEAVPRARVGQTCSTSGVWEAKLGLGLDESSQHKPNAKGFVQPYIDVTTYHDKAGIYADDLAELSHLSYALLLS